MNARNIILVGVALLAIGALLYGRLVPVESIDIVPGVVDSGVVTPQPASIETVTLGEKETKDYTLGILNNEGKLKIIHGTGSKLIVHFVSNNAKLLTVNLKTQGNEVQNIRITQKINPDGTSEGPFGRDLVANLTQTGEFQIIISESLMAEGSGLGEVDLSITLK